MITLEGTSRQARQLLRQAPQFFRLGDIHRLLARIPNHERVSRRGRTGRDRVVVVRPTHAFERGVVQHVQQGISPAVHRLGHVERVRDEIESLHEQRLLVAKEAGAGDQTRAERVHGHLAPTRRQPPLQFIREEHVAQLAVLVSLVGVVGLT